MHINSLSNGIIHDVILEDIEFINDAAKLLDDFEKINEEAYLPAIKVLFDWMKLNPEILKMSGKVCCYFCILIELQHMHLTRGFYVRYCENILEKELSIFVFFCNYGNGVNKCAA